VTHCNIPPFLAYLSIHIALISGNIKFHRAMLCLIDHGQPLSIVHSADYDEMEMAGQNPAYCDMPCVTAQSPHLLLC